MRKSSIVKRSIVIEGHKTSVSLEDAFWTALKDIAHAECVAVSKIVAEVDKTRKLGNLSSALRLFVLDRTRTRGLPMPRVASVRAFAGDGGKIRLPKFPHWRPKQYKAPASKPLCGIPFPSFLRTGLPIGRWQFTDRLVRLNYSKPPDFCCWRAWPISSNCSIRRRRHDFRTMPKGLL